MSNIIANLVQIRRGQNIRAKVIAKHIGISAPTLSSYENGRYEIPLHRAEKYAEALDYELRLLKK